MKLITQPDAGVTPVVQAIRRAKRSINICIFRFDIAEIEQALAAAVQRGVVVRALIAHTNRGGEGRLRKLEKRLLDAGVTVTRTADALLRYHGKFLVVDDVLHVFGFNFTRLDIGKSRSFGIATRDKRTVQEALRLFEADVTRNPYQPSRSNLVVSPETARGMLTGFLKGARKDVSIYDSKISDPAMIKILKDLAARGVRVRVLGHLKGPEDAVLVRSLKTMRLHVRAIVCDGTRAFVGSQSLRRVELEKRREVGLLINNPTVARSLLKVFDADWEASATKEDRDEEKKVEQAVA